MSDTLVLCYHAVSHDWRAPLSITPDQLSEQCDYLCRRGYRAVTFSEALEPGQGRCVAITFDDGFRSVHELGKPILDSFGLRASVFVPTDFPGREAPMTWPGIEHWLGGPHEYELRCMTWTELKALAAAGWEIGSHTRSHPHLTRLDDGALAAELRTSREACEQYLDRACRSLAYPYGDVDARVVRAAHEAGYACAGTLPERAGRFHEPGPLEWPRVGIYHAEPAWRWRLKMAPLARRLRATRAWGAVARAHRLETVDDQSAGAAGL
jgi:peptidoglycan/xylan/chitin deacetylase (PgdA/CDA1 family)